MAGDLASRLLADLLSPHVGVDLARPFRIVLSCLNHDLGSFIQTAQTDLDI